ncbi:acylphosphatase [Luteococcus sp. OSA5]|uniref:acylphosphatase n=1 Tax=Luteococcus sp. OSA5 TaxID=3401630 RepID=UPI003B4398FF
MSDVRAVTATIHGRVQGVGFRWSCLQQAEDLGVQGWVRNLSDGSVEVWAEGEDRAVEHLLSWCRKGPRWAQVDEVAVRAAKPAGHTDFRVR